MLSARMRRPCQGSRMDICSSRAWCFGSVQAFAHTSAYFSTYCICRERVKGSLSYFMHLGVDHESNTVKNDDERLEAAATALAVRS